MRSWCLPIGILITLAARAHGDIFRQLDGGEFVARAKHISDNRVTMLTPMGENTFPVSDFRSVVRTADKSKLWEERKRKAMAEGAEECCAAALWALDAGLVRECDLMIREAVRKNPKHATAARMAKTLDQLAGECADPDIERMSRNLPTEHKIARGPHVLLIHQHSDAESAERVELLEAVIKAYYLYFASLGIELLPPSERLSSMWFAQKADYLNFLRAEGATSFLTTRGYYHPTRRIVVAYDCRSDPDRIQANEAIASATRELDQFGVAVAKIPPGVRAKIAFRGETKTFDRNGAKTFEGALRRRLQIRQIAIELYQREVDWSIAAHETIHQLVVASKLSPHDASFPNSLREGLAMQFESIEGGYWAGLKSPSPIRHRDYRKLDSAPKLEPLIRDLNFGPGYRQRDYAKAWAMTYYLRVEKPSAFVALLDALRAPSATTGTRGEVGWATLAKRLEPDEDAKWRQFMKKLPVGPEPDEPAGHQH